MLLLIKALDSHRHQPWYLDMAWYMDTEARARVGVYVRRIQGLYHRAKFAAFRTVLRDSIGARERVRVYNQRVVIIQAWARRLVYKGRFMCLYMCVYMCVHRYIYMCIYMWYCIYMLIYTHTPA